MKKKVLIDLMTGIFLFILASIILVLPSFKVNDLSFVLKVIFSFYVIFKFVQFIFTFKEKDYESLFTFLISTGVLIATFMVRNMTKNLVLILMIWMGLMCLVKLKKADFYHDRQNKMWILRLMMLIVFLISGILTGINLFYISSVQILLIGNFFLINSILDMTDPIVTYIMEHKK